jgi:hypothetical protein
MNNRAFSFRNCFLPIYGWATCFFWSAEIHAYLLSYRRWVLWLSYRIFARVHACVLQPLVWSYIILEWIFLLDVCMACEWISQSIDLARSCMNALHGFYGKDAHLSSAWRHSELFGQRELTSRNLLIDTCYTSILLLPVVFIWCYQVLNPGLEHGLLPISSLLLQTIGT